MNRPNDTAIVPQPHGLDLLRRCPHCQALFALRSLGNETCTNQGVIHVYQCVKCQTETRYLTSVPDRTL